MTFFGYGLGWYPKKFLYILIHLVWGSVISVSVWAILSFIPTVDIWSLLGNWNYVLRTILFLSSLFIGGSIEWTQNDYQEDRTWETRKSWLLGSARDVLTYALVNWIVFL